MCTMRRVGPTWVFFLHTGYRKCNQLGLSFGMKLVQIHAFYRPGNRHSDSILTRAWSVWQFNSVDIDDRSDLRRTSRSCNHCLRRARAEAVLYRRPGVRDVRETVPCHGQKLTESKDESQDSLLPPQCRAHGQSYHQEHNQGRDESFLFKHLFHLVHRSTQKHAARNGGQRPQRVDDAERRVVLGEDENNSYHGEEESDHEASSEALDSCLPAQRRADVAVVSNFAEQPCLLIFPVREILQFRKRCRHPFFE